MGGKVAAHLRLVAVLSALACLVATPAQAAFPGQNGKIAFVDVGIWTVNPDGTGRIRLTISGGDRYPKWSPNGSRIAFERGTDIWVTNANGPGATLAIPDARHPAWSPSGEWISFIAFEPDSDIGLWIAHPDGSERVEVYSPNHPDNCLCFGHPAWNPAVAGSEGIAFQEPGPDEEVCDPSAPDDCYIANPLRIRTIGTDLGKGTKAAWSPTGARVAFVTEADNPNAYVGVEDASGANRQLLRTGDLPAWSPDGAKIVFNAAGSVQTMNSDGTVVTAVTSGTDADWQPLPYTGYARPKGATPMYASLVPAYNPCSAPNRTHGPPLAFGSCAPPIQASPHLRMGTADANGAPANLIGSLRLGALVGAPGPPNDSDITISMSITDVRCRNPVATCASANSPGDQAGPDYTGQVLISLGGGGGMRITDRFNAVAGGGGSDPATGQDMDFTVPVSCSATASTAVGGTCAIVTSANAVVPGAITDGKRTIVELAQAKVFDAGQDGVLSTPGDGSLFLTQGLFVP
jgi:hypothetical protein